MTPALLTMALVAIALVVLIALFALARRAKRHANTPASTYIPARRRTRLVDRSLTPLRASQEPTEDQDPDWCSQCFHNLPASDDDEAEECRTCGGLRVPQNFEPTIPVDPEPGIFGSVQTGFASDGAPVEAGVQAPFELVEVIEPEPSVPLDDIPRIPCALIVPGDNDRQNFEQSALLELASSIGANGLAQPITIRPIPETADGQIFEIVAGERRFRAVRDILQWPDIPAIVRAYSDREASQIMLLENVMRENLDPIEEAQAYQKRIDAFGWTVAECARQVSKSAEYIRGRLDLLALVPIARELVASGQLRLTYAACMKGLDSERQMLALRYFDVVSNPDIDTFREHCSKLLEDQSTRPLDFCDPDDFLVPLEKRMQWAEEERKRKRWPSADHLPAMPKPKQKAAGLALETYIALLIEEGYAQEAQVVGSVYDGLIAAGLARSPKLTDSPLRGIEEQHIIEPEPLPASVAA